MPSTNDTTPASAAPVAVEADYFGDPFDDEDADIILRSSDDYDFRVYKAILSKASPFFRDMFSLPQPPDEAGPASQVQHSDRRDGLVVIPMSEPESILYYLLTVIYPVDTVLPDDLSTLTLVLTTVKKYDMEGARRTIRALKLKGEDSVLDKKNALRAFGLFYENQLLQEAQLAAQLTLQGPMSLDAYGKRLGELSGAALFHLWKYRKACEAAASECVRELMEGTSSAAQIWFGHETEQTPHWAECMGNTDENGWPLWFKHFWRLGIVSAGDSPMAFDKGIVGQTEKHIAEFYTSLHEHQDRDECHNCSSRAFFNGNRFWDALEKEINDAVRAVPMELPFK